MRSRICLLTVLLVIVLAGPAIGQNRFGFFGGINIANQGGDMEQVGEELGQELQDQFGGTWDSEKSSITGFGAGLTFFIQTSSSFGVQIEGQFIRRGTKIQNSGQDLTISGFPSSVTVTSKFKLNYFEIPLLARYSPSPAASIRPVFFGGPVIGIKTGADIEVEIGGTSQTQDISSGYNDSTVGMILGIGMDVRAGESAHFLLQARYYLGLTNSINDPDIDAKSGDLGFFAGFEFPITPKSGGVEDTPQ